jgi:hypothetical protein
MHVRKAHTATVDCCGVWTSSPLLHRVPAGGRQPGTRFCFLFPLRAFGLQAAPRGGSARAGLSQLVPLLVVSRSLALDLLCRYVVRVAGHETMQLFWAPKGTVQLIPEYVDT